MKGKMRLTLIADKLSKGQFEDGTAFINTLGETIVVKDGGLHWLTKSGYVSSIVGITIDNYREQWQVTTLKTGKNVSFAEALDSIDNGKKVRFETKDGQYYDVDSFEDLDTIVSLFVRIDDLYRSDAYVEEGEKKEDTHIPVDGLIEALGLYEPTGSARTKLADVDVYAIHFRRAYMKDTVKTLAEVFKVTERMVYYILDGTYWNDIYNKFYRDFSEL